MDDDDIPPQFPPLMYVPAVTWGLHGVAILIGVIYVMTWNMIAGWLLFIIFFPICAILIDGSRAIVKGRGSPEISNIFSMFVMCCESVVAVWFEWSSAGVFLACGAVSLFVNCVIVNVYFSKWGTWQREQFR